MASRDLFTPPTFEDNHLIILDGHLGLAWMTCFDQSHEQAWEAVWLHHTEEAAFIIKRSRLNAPHSDLSAKVIVKQKGTTLKAYPENEDACKAVILHHMINCDKYSNTAKDRGSMRNFGRECQCCDNQIVQMVTRIFRLDILWRWKSV